MEKGADPFQGNTALAAVVVITPVWLVRTGYVIFSWTCLLGLCRIFLFQILITFRLLLGWNFRLPFHINFSSQLGNFGNQYEVRHMSHIYKRIRSHRWMTLCWDKIMQHFVPIQFYLPWPSAPWEVGFLAESFLLPFRLWQAYMLWGFRIISTNAVAAFTCTEGWHRKGRFKICGIVTEIVI